MDEYPDGRLRPLVAHHMGYHLLRDSAACVSVVVRNFRDCGVGQVVCGHPTQED